MKIGKLNESLEDFNIDQALRPTSWDEYVGQERIKRNLKIIIEAAKRREEAIDHILLCGQAGLGKTTLAHLITKETQRNLKITTGPTLEKTGDLVSLLSSLEEGDILFVDEAHRMNRMIEEVLYPAMESRELHLIVGKGVAAKSIRIGLPPFTLIAATTRENLLSEPLRSRFGVIFRLDYYNQEEIKLILKRSAKILDVEIGEGALEVLAKASRGTPRIANRLLKRARDYIQVKKLNSVSASAAKEILSLLEIDKLGLEPQDRKLLRTIIEQFGGGPVGINTLSAALSIEKGVIEEIYEPYLMKIGFLKRTPAGRVALPPAYNHLGIPQRKLL